MESSRASMARTVSVAKELAKTPNAYFILNYQVTSCAIGFKQAKIIRHVDYIVPAPLVRRFKAGNPNHRENLQCICVTCPGCKLQADHKLCLGDKLGYLEILRIHNLDMVRIERALAMVCDLRSEFL